MMTKPILNIFSKLKNEEIKEKPKQKIFIDYREKNSLVASELIHLGFEIEFLELKKQGVNCVLIDTTNLEFFQQEKFEQE